MKQKNGLTLTNQKLGNGEQKMCSRASYNLHEDQEHKNSAIFKRTALRTNETTARSFVCELQLIQINRVGILMLVAIHLEVDADAPPAVRNGAGWIAFVDVVRLAIQGE